MSFWSDPWDSLTSNLQSALMANEWNKWIATGGAAILTGGLSAAMAGAGNGAAAASNLSGNAAIMGVPAQTAIPSLGGAVGGAAANDRLAPAIPAGKSLGVEPVKPIQKATPQDPDAQDRALRARQKLTASRGRSDTILTSGLGLPGQGSGQRKTLLGM